MISVVNSVERRRPTLILIAEVALLTLLAVAMATVAVVFVRRARRDGVPEPSGDAAELLRIMSGRIAPTPRPAWVDRDAADPASAD